MAVNGFAAAQDIVEINEGVSALALIMGTRVGALETSLDGIATQYNTINGQIVEINNTLVYVPEGSGPQSRSLQEKLRDYPITVEDYLLPDHDPDTDDATYAFVLAQAALPQYGGIIDVTRVVNYRVNFSLIKNNVHLRGRGSVGELTSSTVPGWLRFPALRPYNTGENTYTLRLGNGLEEVRGLTVTGLSITGDDGFGNQAEDTVLITGGVYLFEMHCDFIDGIRSIVIDPKRSVAEPIGLPIYGGKIRGRCRNDVDDPAKRGVYVRKYADIEGYVTDISIDLKGNFTPTSAGYYCELDGTGSTGLAISMDGYVDCAPGYGILMHGLETIIAGPRYQIDPGVVGAVIIKRLDNVKDPSRCIVGRLLGVGGQYVEFLDGTTSQFPAEPGEIMYMPRIRRAFLGSETYVTKDDSIPWDTSCGIAAIGAGANDPLELFGAPLRISSTLDSVALGSGSGAFYGGVSIAKTLRLGGNLIHYDAAGNLVSIAEATSGGLRSDLVGGGQNFIWVPGSGGYSLFGGNGILPRADNTQTSGAVGNAWSNTVAYKVSDKDGNQVVGGRKPALPADATDLPSALTLLNAIKAGVSSATGHGLFT